MKIGSLPRGNRYFQVGDYDNAHFEFRRFLDEHPENNIVRSMLARCYLGMDRLDEAIAEAEAVLERDRHSIEAYYVLGVALSKRNDFENGKKLLDQALSMSSGSALIYHGLGIIYIDHKKFDESASFFKKALELDPHHWRSSFFLSEIYKLRKDYGNALEQSLKAFKSMPSKSNFYELLVSIALKYSLLLRIMNILLLILLVFGKSPVLIPAALLSIGITLLIGSIFIKRGDPKLGILLMVLVMLPVGWYIFRMIADNF